MGRLWTNISIMSSSLFVKYLFWFGCHNVIVTSSRTLNNCVLTQCTIMTSSNGNVLRVTGLLCGEFTGPRWISLTKASDAELWCFFDLRPNKRVSKQSWGWWSETPSSSLWRQCNESDFNIKMHQWVLMTGLSVILGYTVLSVWKGLMFMGTRFIYSGFV